MTEIIVLPDEFYVGFANKDPDSSEPHLAFLTPNGTDKAFQKRKTTVDNWANQRPYKHISVDGRWVKVDLIPRAAEVLKNELLEGYAISQSIRRTYWGGGNVVWRVVDPRGFEFEISSSNFARIIDCTDVKQGVIQGKCILGRLGAENILLPENSQPYQDAVKVTAAKKTTTINKKNITVGSRITLNTSIEAIFMGKVYVLSVKYGDSKNVGEWYDAITLEQSEWYAIYCDGDILLRKDFKVIEVGPVEKTIDELNAILDDRSKPSYSRYDCTSIGSFSIKAVSLTPFSSYKFFLSNTKMNSDELVEYAKNSHASMYAVMDIGNDTVMFDIRNFISYLNYTSGVICTKMKLTDTSIRYSTEYQHYRYNSYIRCDKETLDKYGCYALQFEVNGKHYNF